jgi:cell division transport system permease protein
MKRFFGAKFTSTLSIALVLFVLGLMTMGGLVAARVAKELRERFTVTITVSDVASTDYGQRLVKRLIRSRYTAEAVYVSADSALKVLQTELGENPAEFLGYNPLSPTVELKLKADYAVADSIKMIVGELERTQGANIAEIDYNHTLLDMVNSNLKRFAIVLAVLAVVLLIICVSLIGNTVRLILHADRFLINTMRLVGATKWFVRWPFIKTHIICGLIAAVVALLALAALVYGGASQGLSHVIAEVLLQPVPLFILVGAVVVLGVLIPAIAAWHAADKYMGKTVDELYLM